MEGINTEHVACLMASCVQASPDVGILVPASDESLVNALHEYSHHGITSTKIIKQYLAKDLGIEVLYVSLNGKLVFSHFSYSLLKHKDNLALK
jgi:hypothetical protein